MEICSPSSRQISCTILAGHDAAYDFGDREPFRCRCGSGSARSCFGPELNRAMLDLLPIEAWALWVLRTEKPAAADESARESLMSEGQLD